MVDQNEDRRNIELRLTYFAQNFFGWQVQPYTRTVQGVLRRVLRRITAEDDLKIIGSSRTDTGVHAHDLRVSFQCRKKIPLHNLTRTLNHLLPADVRVIWARERDADFSARYHPIGKHYTYYWFNREKGSPFINPYTWEYPYILDIDVMAEAARYFEGTRCFRALQSRRDHRAHSKTTIFTTRVDRINDVVFFDVIGHHFLYRMVRNMAACLVRVGCGEWRLADFKRRLDSGDRENLWITAPAKGLHLFKVYFDGDDPCTYAPESEAFTRFLAQAEVAIPESSPPPRKRSRRNNRK